MSSDPTPTPTNTPTPTDTSTPTNTPASGGTVFVGAGDIADCSRVQDEQTAQLLDNIPGTVYTVGDNAYPSGSAADFNNCYDPTWGRHKARTHPAVGDGEYGTPGAQAISATLVWPRVTRLKAITAMTLAVGTSSSSTLNVQQLGAVTPILLRDNGFKLIWL